MTAADSTAGRGVWAHWRVDRARRRSRLLFCCERMPLLDTMASANVETESHSKRANTSGTALSALLPGLSTTFGLRRAFQFPL